MPTPDELTRLRRLALIEQKSPVAAYDAVRPGDDHYHGLDWLTKDGPIAGTIKAANTAVRGATKAINYMNTEDTMPYRPPASLSPRGGYTSGNDADPDLDAENPEDLSGGGGSMDPQEAYETIQTVLNSVGPAERSQFIARLKEYCDAEQGTASAASSGAADRARKRLAQDARSTASARRSRNFLDRYPGAANIEVWGNRGGY